MKLCPPLLNKIRWQLLVAKYPKPGPSIDKIQSEFFEWMIWNNHYVSGMALASSMKDGSEND